MSAIARSCGPRLRALDVGKCDITDEGEFCLNFSLLPSLELLDFPILRLMYLVYESLSIPSYCVSFTYTQPFVFISLSSYVILSDESIGEP